MGRYIARRILWLVPVLFIISIMTFALTKMVPGGPFNSEKPLPAEIIANLNQHYGLDQPAWKQYTDYMGADAQPQRRILPACWRAISAPPTPRAAAR